MSAMTKVFTNIYIDGRHNKNIDQYIYRCPPQQTKSRARKRTLCILRDGRVFTINKAFSPPRRDKA